MSLSQAAPRVENPMLLKPPLSPNLAAGGHGWRASLSGRSVLRAFHIGGRVPRPLALAACDLLRGDAATRAADLAFGHAETTMVVVARHGADVGWRAWVWRGHIFCFFPPYP